MAIKAQLDVLSTFGTATIHEALGRIGNLPHQIKPLNKKMRLCGPAYPVQCKQYSNVNLHRAYAHAMAGDIIIADCSGAYDAGYWGDLLTTGAMNHGIAGFVIDGCIRDGDEIEALGFPVFCRGLAIRGTGKDPDGYLNEPITIGEIEVVPGDIVVGDRDGVVIVPKDSVEEAIEKSRARDAKETSVKVLGEALKLHYDKNDAYLLDLYTEICLRRVWKVEGFSRWFTTTTHTFPNQSAFDYKMQAATLRYIIDSEVGSHSVAENYVGLPFENKFLEYIKG